MKKIFSPGRLIGLTILASALPSCSKQANPESVSAPKTVVVEASSADEFRTVLDGKDVLWDGTDTLSCLCYTDSPATWAYLGGIAPESYSGKSATFKITTLSGLQPRILINPDNTSYEMAPDGGVLIPLSSAFHASAGEVPQESLISVGAIENGKALMRNALSYMKFNIESSDICRIRVRTMDSTAISGTLKFNPLTLESSVEGSDCINLYPVDTAEVFAPGLYYLPVPAVACAKGLSVKFYRQDGLAAKKSLETAYTINRNRFIDMGRESEWNLEFLPATRTVTIQFSNGTTSTFPFSDAPSAQSAISTPSVSSMAGAGRKGPYYPLGYPGVEVYFCVQNTSGSKSYFTSSGTYGLRFGGTIGDYMTIPVLSGYRLSNVSMEYGSKTGYYAVTTDPLEGEAQRLTSQFSGKTPKTASFDFVTTQTLANTSYRISTTKTNETAIKSVTYTYEVVD